MVRGVRGWVEILVFFAMVPFLPLTWLIMYTLMERWGLIGL